MINIKNIEVTINDKDGLIYNTHDVQEILTEITEETKFLSPNEPQYHNEEHHTSEELIESIVDRIKADLMDILKGRVS